MNEKNKYVYLSFALAISIIAAVLIELVFIIILLRGIMMIFNFPYVIFLFSLLVLGAVNNIMFLKSTNYARIFFKNVTPISLILAGLGIIVGYLGNFVGLFLIFIAYIFEIITGMKLRDDLAMISDSKWSGIFVGGVVIFVLSMPLMIYNVYFALIPMIGDAIKTVGIYFIYKDLRG
ncbi:MAG: hypothetical protein QW128_03750 [Thermoprotei archaeon]